MSSRAQDWDFVNYQRFGVYNKVLDDSGNQYMIINSNHSQWASPDSILRHTACCNDTLRTTNKLYEPVFFRLIKLNAAGKMEWQLKDSFNLDVVRMKIINNELYLLSRAIDSSYHFNGISKKISNSFMDSLPNPYFMIHISSGGKVLEFNPIFSTGKIPLHFDVINNDYVFYSHGGLTFADGKGLWGSDSLATKVFRVTKKGELVWSVERPKYLRSGFSKFTKTDAFIYFFTRDTITVFRNAPIIYKLDFDGNILDSISFKSKKIGFNYFLNLDHDSDGNVYAIGYIVEPVVIDGVSIQTAPFVKKPLLLKLDKDLNYVWHRELCDSNLQDVNQVAISPNDAIWCHISIEKNGSTTNGIRLTGMNQWVKYNTDGDLVEVLDQPNTTPPSTYDDSYASYHMVYETINDEIYVSGYLSYRFDFNPQIHFGDITIKSIPQTQAYFTAKRNRKLLKLTKDNISCRSDSLELAYDARYKKFEWYLLDSSCEVPKFIGEKYRPEGLTKGKYPLLVKAYVNDSLYWCLKDTFEVIEKPVAAFTTEDTVICAYVPLEFTTQSTTDNIHTTNGEKWVWTFGDGETQTVLLPFGEDRGGDISVSHVYTTPSTYTVSLFYSNGFCDSTLTRNQYITVVDAPAPGFSIDNNRGCTPFTVTVTDTITKNTTKKEYLVSGQLAFMDSLPFSGSWDEYYSLPFGEGRGGAFTFSQAGTYWIAQRLYGYTGCVTQLDSQRVFVTPGFTEYDTSHITNATYQDVPADPKVDEVITINWPCLLEDASVRYDLYRNNQKIAELDSQPCVYGQMWYADSLEQASTSIVTYTVVAIDSCGTATQIGRVGQPVHVSGEVVGNNEFSIIRYTAYQDWNVGESELSYELQTEDLLGGWMTINEQTSATPYNDYEFLGGVTQSGVEGSTSLSMTSLEKCYRVVAKAGPSKSSISAILCLPYSPVVFIPTAFTPNADGLNDVWRPVTFGIEFYEVNIYNRYGQKIAQLDQTSPGWDAAEAPLGAYAVTIRAKGTDNLWYNLKSTVTVVR
jgi:gliding motility-associated-like protein